MSAIGQAGNLIANTTVTGQEITVNFAAGYTFDNPVIHLTGSNYGGNKFSFRVTEIIENAAGEATGFKFTMDEWENHDGPHPAMEDIHWLAIESGVHTLPDGRVIEAGYADADSDGETVSLGGSYTTDPVILSTVASDNHPSVVDSDPYGYDAVTNSFTLAVEEAESQDGTHGLESVGYIAIQPGGDGTSGTAAEVGGVATDWDNNIGYGATYTDAVVLAETQTQNDPDTGNVIIRNIGASDVDVRFEEDTSVDADTGHANEDIALVTFESGVILCFTERAQIDTPRGPRPIMSLRPGDLILTQDQGPQPLLWSQTTQAAAQSPEHAPIRIEAGAIAPGVPARTSYVSPQHRILITGWRAELNAGESQVLVPAKALVNGTSIRQCAAKPQRYVHLLFETHQLITADGMVSESLHPGEMARGAFDASAREELFTLFTRLRSENNGYGATARLALSVHQGRALAA